MSKTDDLLAFTLSANVQPLKQARDQLTIFLSKRMNEIERNRILLAVEEALVNIFDHGYNGGPGNVQVNASWSNEGLTIQLTDQAKQYDPTSVPLPSPQELTEIGSTGGYGLFLLRTLMKVVYSRSENGDNTLLLSQRKGQV